MAPNVHDVENAGNVVGANMAKETVKRVKNKYSVWIVQWFKKGVDPNDPKSVGINQAEFESERDAEQAIRLLYKFSEDEGTFGIVRDIRSKDVQPKINRKVIERT